MMQYRVLPVAVILVFFCVAGCERVDQAIDTYKKAKELKSDFQKKSEEDQKGIADKAEDYKDRIRKRVGMETGREGKEGDSPYREDDREGKEQPERNHGDKD
jgi:hypothetical protein